METSKRARRRKRDTAKADLEPLLAVLRSNHVRLALSPRAYNLGNQWRRLALPQRIENWSLTSLQQRVVKTGGRLVKHARYYWLFLAEGHLNRWRLGAMLAGSRYYRYRQHRWIVIQSAGIHLETGL